MKFENVTENITRHVERQFAQKTADWLSDIGIVRWAPFRAGGSARVLIGETAFGKMGAIRIPYKFGNGQHDRANHPAVIAPLFGKVGYKEGTNIEALPIMPFVQIETHKGSSPQCLPRSTVGLLDSMFQSSGLQSTGAGMFKDGIPVLPDGTPLLGDPDNSKVRSGYVGSARSRMDSWYKQFPYMSRLSWWEGDQTKQRIFFGNDYLSGPKTPLTADPRIDNRKTL